MSQEHQGSRQSDSTQDNLVIVALRWWSTLALSFAKCIRLLSCCVLFAMVTAALRDLKEMNTGDGNQSNTLKRMCVWNSLLLQISVWLHNWSCRCDANAKTSWNRSYSRPKSPNTEDAHNHKHTHAHSFFHLIFLESTTYIANSGLHYLQARLLLQLLLLLNCTGRQKQRRCWVWAADDKVADFSVPEAEQVVSETENDAMDVTAWFRCQTGHRKWPAHTHTQTNTHTHTHTHTKSLHQEEKQNNIQGKTASSWQESVVALGGMICCVVNRPIIDRGLRPG